jgi:hydrogenase/urease accessory protein HupE
MHVWMGRAFTVFSRAAGVALVVTLLLPAVAAAHALFGDSDPNRPVGEYVWLGFLHMVAGWDHLLFIAGVVLLAGTLGRAAKVISLFVLGHSITLLTATLAGWQLDATAVDVVIALSLVYVGVQGLRGRPDDLRVFGAIVFGFGLVHGLGLSTRLQDLGLPDDGLVVRVLLFNVGVEIGQLSALAVMVGVGTLLARLMTDPGEWHRVAYIALGAAGLVAAALLSFPGEEERVVASGCKQGTSQAPPPSPDAGHPPKRFYGPDEQAPEGDLAHVIGDGFLIVRYRPDLSAGNVRAIEALVTSGSEVVIAAPAPGQNEAVRAIQAEQTLSCKRVEEKALTEFRDEWIARVRQ